MRRFLLLLAAAAFLLTASAGPAAAFAAAAPGPSCVSAATATYRHSLDGAAGTVTITAVRPLCDGQTQAFSLVSYTAPAGSTAAGQFVYDAAHATISSSRPSRTLKVAVPSCDTRVYAVIGSAVADETTSDAAAYGTTLLGSATGAGSRSAGAPAEYSGGDTACAATPEVTFTNDCDGTLTAALSNGAGANAKAVFVTGGRLIRVAPGRATELTAPKGTTLTIRASSFTTYVGRWRTPVPACTAAAAPAVAAPAVVTTPPPASPLATSGAPTPSASAFTAAAEAPRVFAGLPSDEPTAALAKTGMGIGSVLAVGLGLFMVGGGVVALTHVVRTLRRPA